MHLILCKLYHFQDRYAREPNANVACGLCLARFHALLPVAPEDCTAVAGRWDARSPAGIPSLENANIENAACACRVQSGNAQLADGEH